MFRLELQLSTLSLVAFLAVIVPLPPAALALYLGIDAYAPKHLLRVASLVTAVFLVSQSLAFLMTALTIVRTRPALALANGLPLLGTLVAGLVLFCTRIHTLQGPGDNNDSEYVFHGPVVRIESACMVLWLLAIVTSSAIAVYTIIHTQLLEYHQHIQAAPPLAHSQHASMDYRTPDKNRLIQYHTLSSTGATAAVATSSPGHKQADSGHTFVGSPSAGSHTMFSFLNQTPHYKTNKRDSLRPLFRAHHQSDSATLGGGSFANYSYSDYGQKASAFKLQQLMHSNNPSWASAHPALLESLEPPNELEALGLGPIPQPSSLFKDPEVPVPAAAAAAPAAPMILPKQRKTITAPVTASTSALVSTKLRNFSNGLRRISKGGAAAAATAPTEPIMLGATTTAHDHTQDDLANSYLSFDAWDVNSASVRSKLLLSTTSRSSLRSRSHGHGHGDGGPGGSASRASSASSAYTSTNMFNDLLDRAGFAPTPGLPSKPKFAGDCGDDDDEESSDAENSYFSDDSDDDGKPARSRGLGGPSSGFKSYAFLGPMFETPAPATATPTTTTTTSMSTKTKNSTPTSLTSSFSFQDHDDTTYVLHTHTPSATQQQKQQEQQHPKSAQSSLHNVSQWLTSSSSSSSGTKRGKPAIAAWHAHEVYSEYDKEQLIRST